MLKKGILFFSFHFKIRLPALEISLSVPLDGCVGFKIHSHLAYSFDVSPTRVVPMSAAPLPPDIRSLPSKLGI